MTDVWYILPLALIIDLAAGDPYWLPHPVRLMGWAAKGLEPAFRNFSIPLELSGFLFAGALLAASYLATLGLVLGLGAIHPFLALIGQVFIVYTCLAPRCLHDEAMKVRKLLTSGEISAARKQVGMLVSRDTRSLDETGITRAAIETVAENFVDGVLSPIFYAAVLGAPGAVAFKMASTLDSMVGYKNDKYLQFGKASARLDDILNWIPARLSIPVTAIAAGLLFHRGRSSFQTVRRESSRHHSPNAGRPEAAFAGALGVKINGPNIHHGKQVDKPWIGKDFNPPVPADIEKAAQLMIISTLVGFLAVMGLDFLLSVLLM